MKTFILADNQFVTREGMTALIRSEKISEIIIFANDVKELQETLRMHPNAVVVIDYAYFDFTSAQQMLNAKQGAKDSSWILFSNELDDLFIRQVLLSDTTLSMVMKNNSKEEIYAALQNALYNEPYICNLAESLLKSSPLSKNIEPLTASEKTVLHEIALGKTTKEIASEKCLSFHTVNTHRKNIFRKLKVNNLQEAIRYALKTGIIEQVEYYI